MLPFPSSRLFSTRPGPRSCGCSAVSQMRVPLSCPASLMILAPSSQMFARANYAIIKNVLTRGGSVKPRDPTASRKTACMVQPDLESSIPAGTKSRPSLSDAPSIGSRTADRRLLILTSLAGGDKHGYALMQDISDFSGTRLGPGTLYGALQRLEADALIESLPAVARRQPYRITELGRQALRSQLSKNAHVAQIGLQRLEVASP